LKIIDSSSIICWGSSTRQIHLHWTSKAWLTLHWYTPTTHCLRY